MKRTAQGLRLIALGPVLNMSKSLGVYQRYANELLDHYTAPLKKKMDGLEGYEYQDARDELTMARDKQKEIIHKVYEKVFGKALDEPDTKIEPNDLLHEALHMFAQEFFNLEAGEAPKKVESDLEGLFNEVAILKIQYGDDWHERDSEISNGPSHMFGCVSTVARVIRQEAKPNYPKTVEEDFKILKSLIIKTMHGPSGQLARKAHTAVLRQMSESFLESESGSDSTNGKRQTLVFAPFVAKLSDYASDFVAHYTEQREAKLKMFFRLLKQNLSKEM